MLFSFVAQLFKCPFYTFHLSDWGQSNQRATKQVYTFSKSERAYYCSVPNTFMYAFNLFDDGFVSIAYSLHIDSMHYSPFDIMNGIKNGAFCNKAVIYIDDQMHKV